MRDRSRPLAVKYQQVRGGIRIFFVPLQPNHPTMAATFHTVNFDCEIPLSFDTLFYVESIDNKQLNRLMLDLSADVQNLSRSLKTTPQPFSLHLRYVTQKEVSASHLASQLQELGYPEDEVTEYVKLLQEGLAAETGGSLALRLAPRYGNYGPMWDEATLLTTPLLQCDTPDAIWNTMQEFANKAARENFLHLTGMTYHEYLSEKNDSHSYSYSLPQGCMGFLRVKPDLNKIDRELDQHARELLDIVSEKFPNKDISILLQRSSALLENAKKIQKICKLTVTDDGLITFRDPDGAKRKCDFGRGIIGRVLYILFLRQIERFHLSLDKSPGISRNHLNKYHKEMVEIYKKISNKTYRYKTDGELDSSIEKLWRKPSNEISHINTFFDETFDIEMLEGKHYTIEKMDELPDDDEMYAIRLDKNDFDLGAYSINRL